MALQLLGSKYCIESLRTDVTDLQEAIIDIFSRAGPVRLPSWKYPDKMSSELDMTDLLEIYDYSDDEEDRQIAHIVLLELVIDRMVLLVQSLIKYLTQTILSGTRSSPSPQLASTGNSSSIGLVVKKYWNKVVHLQTHLQNVQSENKSNKRKITDLENNIKKVLKEKGDLELVTETLQENLDTAKTPFPLSEADLERKRATSVLSISRDECNKSTQTIETAFVPCECCNCVQKNLKQVGDKVIAMCESQNLPSCLAKFKPQVAALSWLQVSDIMRWTSEQNKDLARLTKHLSDFDALKAELESERQKNKRLQESLNKKDKAIKLEVETQSAQRKHYESQMTYMEKVNSETVNRMNKKNEELDRSKLQLQQQLQQMKQQLDKQQDMMHDLDEAKKRAEQDAIENKINGSEVKKMEVEIEKMEEQLGHVSSELHTAQQDLTKEKAKSNSISKHGEAMRGKQESLLQRIDCLDQSNEELKILVEELEGSKEELEEALSSVQEQKQELEQNLDLQKELVKAISSEKQVLETSINELKCNIGQLETSLQEAKEYEQLLVEYPDLNGPINPDLTGTGNIAEDMDNQVKANCVRIQLLEDQNIKLRHSITKILKTQAEQALKNTQHIPLWNPQINPSSSKPHASDNITENIQVKLSPKPFPEAQSVQFVRESFVVSKTLRPTDKKMSPRSFSEIKSRIGPNIVRSKLKKQTGESAKAVMCPKCDKGFSSKKDLEIHKSYCQG